MTHVAAMSRYFFCGSKLLSSCLFKNNTLLRNTFVSDHNISSQLRTYGGLLSQKDSLRRCFPAAANTRRFSEAIIEGKNVFEGPEPEPEIKSDFKVQNQKDPESFSLEVLVSLLRQENAVDICVIKVPEHISYTQYFVVVGGVSSRHLAAMSQYAVKVYKYLKKDQQSHVRIEGKNSDDWMCVDFGSMVVHLMLQETRDEYELEKLWTLRGFDEKLQRMPSDSIPEDFIYDLEDFQK